MRRPVASLSEERPSLMIWAWCCLSSAMVEQKSRFLKVDMVGGFVDGMEWIADMVMGPVLWNASILVECEFFYIYIYDKT